MSQADDKSASKHDTGRPGAGGLHLAGTPPDRGSPDHPPRAEAPAPPPAPASPRDPDTAGLPPGIALPDPDKYRADQLRAQWINSVVGLVIVTLFWLTTSRFRSALGAVTAVVAFYFVINFVRYQRAMSKLRMKGDHIDREQ